MSLPQLHPGSKCPIGFGAGCDDHDGVTNSSRNASKRGAIFGAHRCDPAGMRVPIP